MYFIQVQWNKKGRYALITPDGTTTARYLYAMFFNTLQDAKNVMEDMINQNPDHNFKIIKK